MRKTMIVVAAAVLAATKPTPPPAEIAADEPQRIGDFARPYLWMSNEKQRNRLASRQLQDRVGGVTPAGLSPDGNEIWRWLPFWCARWD